MRRFRDRIHLLPRGLFAVVLVIACDASESKDPDPAPSDRTLPIEATRPVESRFVGSQACIRCHPSQGEGFLGSDHDRAMEEATPESVLGRFDGTTFARDDETWRFAREGDRFFVDLEGADRPAERLSVAYTFGVEPLQQFLVRRPRGRFQALPVAWDSRPGEEGGQRWIDLQAGESVPPGDPLHWEGLAYNWNSQCAACHSTDFAKGYDVSSDSFESRWAEIDVGCEACHGPGSGHVALRDPDVEAPPGTLDLGVRFDAWNPDLWKRSSGARIASRTAAHEHDVQLDVCAPCHSRRGQIVDTPEIGAPFLDGHRPAFLEPGLYFEDGQIRDEVYVWGSFLQSRMYAAGVRCNDCHDPHSLEPRREGNALCTGCHEAAAYDGPEHHGHARDTRGAACVDCHMPSRVYMKVDARRDHSFPVPRPMRSALLGAPDACSGCHAKDGPGWAEDRIESWRADGASSPPHWTDHLVEGDRAREDWQRWQSIALDRDLPEVVRATAWTRLAEEADPSELGSLAREMRTTLGEGTDLERLAAVEAVRRVAPDLRVSLLRPLFDDPRFAIRIAAAEAVVDAPASAFRPEDRAALAGAIGEHRAHLLANAERPDAQVALGTLAIQLGEPDEARAAYRRALERAPYFVPAYVNLADLERMLGRNEEAVGWLQRAIEWAPEDAMVLYAYGLALHRAGRSEAALVELERAAAAAPDEPRLVLAWALSLDAAGHSEEAIATLEDAIDRGGRSDDLHFALVTLLRDQGKLGRARTRAEAWREANPADPRPQALLREFGTSGPSAGDRPGGTP